MEVEEDAGAVEVMEVEVAVEGSDIFSRAYIFFQPSNYPNCCRKKYKKTVFAKCVASFSYFYFRSNRDGIQSRPIEMRILHRNERCRISAIH